MAKTKTNLAQKMCAVMSEINSLPKLGIHQSPQFHYLTEETLLDAVRPLLAKHGIALTQDIEHWEKENNVCIVQLKLTFTCSDTGEQLSSTAVAEGADNRDKGFLKAITRAYKYALKNSFVISSAEDAEEDGKQIESAMANHTGTTKKPKSKEGKEAAQHTKLKQRIFNLFNETKQPKALCDKARKNYFQNQYNTSTISKLSNEQLMEFGVMFSNIPMAPDNLDDPSPRAEWIQRWAKR